MTGRPKNTPARAARTAATHAEWAARIKELRSALGDVTQADLAARLGMDAANARMIVSQWERGVRGPGKANQAKIAALEATAPLRA